VRAVNLIPPDQRRGAGGLAGRTGGVAYVVLGMLVALVVLGSVYALAVHQVATHKATLAQVTSEAGAVQQQVGALQPYVTFDALAKQRVQAVAQLAEERFNWPRAMQQVALALPSNVTLTSLVGDAGGGAPSGSTGATATTGATSSTATTTTTATVGAPADGTIVNAPTLTLSACAAGSVPTGQLTVATTIQRVRELEDVSSASVAEYSAGGCGGVTFNITVVYNNAYAIPPAHLTASPNTTAGG
jgi:Tfp pilus assembly protein PilN